jgi:glycosyltransferase involved in cell wall biosynthesis
MISSSGRVLLCGPVLPDTEIGGLLDVLEDLAAGLREHGWIVDSMLRPADTSLTPTVGASISPQGWRSLLGTLGRLSHAPESWRFVARVALNDARLASRSSAVFRAIEQRLRMVSYDAVLACVDCAPVGLASLVTRLHPKAVLINLYSLPREIRARGPLRQIRRLASRFAREPLHADLFQPVDPGNITTAVFASGSWRDDATRAGVQESVTRVIRFGLHAPLHKVKPSAPGSPVRLLWAGRLSPEKGLHFFLPAVALARKRLPLRLTVVEATGTLCYRRYILRLIDRLGLHDVVQIRPAVSRDALPALFASHDAFLFYSIFREPVAQMLLMAAAAGLVVVGPHSTDRRSLVRPDQTAFCFGTTHPGDMAQAIYRSVTELGLRERVSAYAYAEVASKHSLDHTVAAYHALLSRVAGVRRQPLAS